MIIKQKTALVQYHLHVFIQYLCRIAKTRSLKFLPTIKIGDRVTFDHKIVYVVVNITYTKYGAIHKMQSNDGFIWSTYTIPTLVRRKGRTCK